MSKQVWLTLAAALLALPGGAQFGGPCDCGMGVFYSDNPNTTEPACVGSFGITWTSEQSGICEHEECPQARNCTGDYTISAMSAEGETECTWEIYASSPFLDGVEVPGDFRMQFPYSLACGTAAFVLWYANGVDLGGHFLECGDCWGG